jgi:GTP-binding protein HflX
MAGRSAPIPLTTERERAALVAVVSRTAPPGDAERRLEELAGLAQAAGAAVVLRVVQVRAAPDPATFVGRGTLERLRAASEEARVDLVVFDNELTPAQQRNLEDVLGRRVLDRTELILAIFARRARTREGKLQVELAQLQYLLPRLVGHGQMLSRLGGGIGTRGPGETKLETDRRRIRHRIVAIRRAIEEVRRRRAGRRERRHKRAVPTAALVGYTNAGKTTLFNRLTGAAAPVSDALFVTLDPLVRRLRLPDARQVLLSDTVGFIDRLPHSLVAAFRATLEEVVEADLLVHVVDAAAPDRDRRAAAVRRVLVEVGAEAVPVVDVFNKCDLLDPAAVERLRAAHPGAVCVSAQRGDGVAELLDVLTARLGVETERVALEFDGASDVDTRRIRELYRYARVVRHVTRDGRVSIEADIPRRLRPQLTGWLPGAP